MWISAVNHLSLVTPLIRARRTREKEQSNFQCHSGEASARASRADIALGLAAGADAYICKPFSVRDLVERVYDLLGPEGGRAGIDRGEVFIGEIE